MLEWTLDDLIVIFVFVVLKFKLVHKFQLSQLTRYSPVTNRQRDRRIYSGAPVIGFRFEGLWIQNPIPKLKFLRAFLNNQSI